MSAAARSSGSAAMSAVRSSSSAAMANASVSGAVGERATNTRAVGAWIAGHAIAGMHPIGSMRPLIRPVIDPGTAAIVDRRASVHRAVREPGIADLCEGRAGCNQRRGQGGRDRELRKYSGHDVFLPLCSQRPSTHEYSTVLEVGDSSGVDCRLITRSQACRFPFRISWFVTSLVSGTTKEDRRC
jgi:hypothetical protein